MQVTNSTSVLTRITASIVFLIIVTTNELTVDLPARRLFLQQTRIESQW